MTASSPENLDVVISGSGPAISGHYAAGEITGGFHRSDHMTPSSLGTAAVFGRLAGRHAARN